MKAIISKAARRKWAWVLALVMIVSIVIPTSLLTAKADVGTVKFIDGAAGWLESAYAQWTIDNQAEGYTAYIKKASQSDSAYARIDNELIRKYKNYYRVDAVGLAAGDYVITMSDKKTNEGTKITGITDELKKEMDAAIPKWENTVTKSQKWEDGGKAGSIEAKVTVNPDGGISVEYTKTAAFKKYMASAGSAKTETPANGGGSGNTGTTENTES